MSNKPDRLFVPLTTQAFEDFSLRGKKVEVRKVMPNFSPKTVYEGRPVELRKGYSGESMWGVIGTVVIGTLSDVIRAFPLKEVEPRFSTYEEAIQDNQELLGIASAYIAFHIYFEEK